MKAWMVHYVSKSDVRRAVRIEAETAKAAEAAARKRTDCARILFTEPAT